MPLIITNTVSKPAVLDEQALIAQNTKEDGSLTLEGLVLDNFLDSVDYTDLFEHEALAEFVEKSAGYAQLIDGEYVECDEDDEGAEWVEIESLPAGILAEAIDMDDLTAMYGYHTVNEMSETGDIFDKACRAAAIATIGGDDAVDEYKRGDFANISKSSSKGHGLVNRMLGAMYYKGDVHRAKASAKNKYKAPGATGPNTYTKGYTKANSTDDHPTGKAAGKRTVQQWQLYKKKSAAKGKAAAMKTLGAKTTKSGGKKVTAQSIKKAMAKPGVESKSLKGKGKGKGKSLAESGSTPTPKQPASGLNYGLDMNESANQAKLAIANTRGVPAHTEA